jgi:hypothetical protein
MTVSRWLSSAVIFAGVSVGLARPASADPAPPGGFDGTYTYTGAGITQTWIATSCGTGCTHIEASPVADQAGFSGDAKMGYGGWELTRLNVPDAVLCKDGSLAPGNITYRWNPGWADTWTSVGVCGDPPRTMYQQFPFILTKVS